ncbi:flagellar basal body P-ring formation chaperone FlgA [Aquabacterium sp.]|uniref:flagellar basal body P-ring formation chaperone FlgA n=1 Tax=Aquabacterium sp. TaxID=1872578 RepID=UPI002D7E3FD3|nr:flagellar basal body P-ring formation chaperone FlgA [Aquabacterium sp.]
MPGILGKRGGNMSRIKRRKTCHFQPLRQAGGSDHHDVKKIALPLRTSRASHASRASRALHDLRACAVLITGLAIGLAAGTACAEGIDAGLAQQLQQLASTAAGAAMGPGGGPMRVAVEIGQLDPRLKLAPCEQILPYLPTGVRPYGRTRIGLRCLQGPTKWNVYLPVTVKLFAPALVAASALPAGTLLEARHLQRVEVDLAASPDPAITAAPLALGRTLARPLAAGDTLRRMDLKARQYFNAGDVVRVVAVGQGYAVSAEGQAVTAGVEGQTARVRVESGRVLSGVPSGDRRMEIAL